MGRPKEQNQITCEANLVAQTEPLLAYIISKIAQQWRTQISPDDILQEVWVTALKNAELIHTLDSHALRGWLKTVAGRTIISLVRKYQAHKRGGGQPAEPNIEWTVFELWQWASSSQETPSREASKEEILATIRNCLASLPANHADILREHYLDGQSVIVLAERYKISRATANRRLYEARQSLRAIIGPTRDFFSNASDSEALQ